MKFLPKDQQKNPFGIEVHFCKRLEKYSPKEMSEDQAKLFMAICLATEDEVVEMEKDIAELYWFYPAIDKRIKAMYTYTMDTKAKLTVTTWCNTIGDMVIYLTFIQYLCKERGVKHIDVDTLSHLFPSGIIDREFMHQCWDGQKVEKGDGSSDNLIDYPEALKSLLF